MAGSSPLRLRLPLPPPPPSLVLLKLLLLLLRIAAFPSSPHDAAPAPAPRRLAAAFGLILIPPPFGLPTLMLSVPPTGARPPPLLPQGNPPPAPAEFPDLSPTKLKLSDGVAADVRATPAKPFDWL